MCQTGDDGETEGAIVTDQWKKEVEDALTVMGGLQARQGRVLKEHSEWLQEHDRTMARIEASLAEQAAAGKATDERIEKLLGRVENSL
jgi:hypothetical protein